MPASGKLVAALGVAAFSIVAGSMYARKKLEDRIGDMILCKTCIQDMLQHKPTLEVLGEPITWRRPDLDNKYNRITTLTAEIALPVSGQKKFGNLLIEATREDADVTWTLKTLKLKIADEELVIK